jgi:MFS family permease
LIQAKTTRTFWAFNIGLSMFALLLTATTFHIVSIFNLNGLPRNEAISIFFPASVIAVTLNLIAGWLSDMPWMKYRLKYYLIFLLCGLMFISVGILLLSVTSAKWFIIIGDGMASGMFGTLVAIVWPRYFGRKHLGEIAGYNMSFLVFFSAIGPPVFGASFSLFGNYLTGAGIIMAVLVGMILFSFKADRPKLQVNL